MRRVRLLGVHAKHDEADKQQELLLKCYIDNMTDLNIKTYIEEKLRDVDSKNDTIHVRIATLYSQLGVKFNYHCMCRDVK